MRLQLLSNDVEHRNCFQITWSMCTNELRGLEYACPSKCKHAFQECSD